MRAHAPVMWHALWQHVDSRWCVKLEVDTLKFDRRKQRRVETERGHLSWKNSLADNAYHLLVPLFSSFTGSASELGHDIRYVQTAKKRHFVQQLHKVGLAHIRPNNKSHSWQIIIAFISCQDSHIRISYKALFFTPTIRTSNTYLSNSHLGLFSSTNCKTWHIKKMSKSKIRRKLLHRLQVVAYPNTCPGRKNQGRQCQ